MQMLVNFVEPISNPTVISGVQCLFGTAFFNFADERVKLGIYRIKLFAQRFFHLSDEVRHEFVFEPIDVWFGEHKHTVQSHEVSVNRSDHSVFDIGNEFFCRKALIPGIK